MRNKILHYLRQHGEATSQVLAEEVLKLRTGHPALYERILRATLQDDPDVQMDPEGRWQVVARPVALSNAVFAVAEVLFVEAPYVRHCPIEIGVARITGKIVEAMWTSLIRPEPSLPSEGSAALGIANDELNAAPILRDVLSEAMSLLEGTILVGDDVGRITGLLERGAGAIGEVVDYPSISIRCLTKRLMPEEILRSLEDVGSVLGTVVEDDPRVAARIQALTEITAGLLERCADRGIASVEDLLSFVYPEVPPLDFSPYAFDRERLDALPDRPGVYWMRDRSGTVIYVGKAKSLRNRVRSYFSRAEHRAEKVQRLLEVLYDLDYEVVGSELEALLLETRRIREHRPAINVQLQIHERPISYGQRRNLILVLPSRAEDQAELFFMHQVRPLRQLTLSRSTDDESGVRALVEGIYFADGGDDEALSDEEREDVEILLRWWTRHRDTVRWVDMDTVADADDAVRLLKQYLESGPTDTERIIYV